MASFYREVFAFVARFVADAGDEVIVVGVMSVAVASIASACVSVAILDLSRKSGGYLP